MKSVKRLINAVLNVCMNRIASGLVAAYSEISSSFRNYLLHHEIKQSD